MQRISQRMLRLSLSGALLALLVLLTFNVGTTYAAACGGLTATGITADCQVAIPAITASGGTLTYSADSALTITSGTTPRAGGTNPPYTYVSNGSNHDFGILFHTKVIDHRGDTNGWNLAASTDLDHTKASITLGTSTATCSGTCFPLVADISQASPKIDDTTGAQKFVGVSDSSTEVNTGTYNIATTGTLTIVGSTVAAGTSVSGTITLTLSNVTF